ncbi:unnamed protein product [Caretta caretta]
MVDVIHPDQTYTVPGRSIFDNLFLVWDLLELGRRDGLSFALLSLDQEMAFDRADHGYLLSTLQAFGFGPQFVSFLWVLYASTACLVRLNWTLTEPVSFGRGVRQGCPLSGQLYTLAIKPFLCLLRRRMTGFVLQEPELRLVLLAYADDLLLVVQDPGDLARVEACQATYSAASSTRVNWVKSSGLAVGDWRQEGGYSVIFLQETHTDPTAEESWQLEWGDRVYFSHSTIRQAGVATLFSPNLRPKVLGVAEAMQGCLLHLRVHIEGLVVNLINVYAPTSGPEQLQFYQQASAFLGTLDSHECLVLGGDFNTTLEERDRLGTEQCPAATDTLWEIVEHHSLVDIWCDHHPDDTSTFTFVRVEAHRSSHSQLDRIYISRFHLSRAHSSSIQLAPFSDHHLVTMTASLCAERPGPAYWHFNNSLLEDEGFMTSFQEFWLAWQGQWRAFPSARRWWDLGKVRARLFCHDYTRGTSRWRNAVIEQLEREVLELERYLAASPEDPLLCGACQEKREELRALEDHQARGAFVRSRIRLLREMDRGSRFFCALEKTRGGKKHVTCLLAEDGTPLTEPAEMCGRARAFYASLFSPDPTDPSACRVLWEELSTVSASDQDQLELPLTLAEFSEALCRMPTNKSPGMDRLTVEFYRVFWDILGPDRVTVWAESLQSGVLPLSCRRAVLALLPKKGDLRDLQNWRPVSLLIMDYKIVAKAISLQLGSVLADMIHPDQTYTVPDRSIFDNLFLVRDLLELGRRDECLVKLNWTLTEPVSFGRLTELVLQEPELQLVLSAYADDVLLVIQDPGDLARVEACQAIYSASSSARVNWVKNSGLAKTYLIRSRGQNQRVQYYKKSIELLIFNT